nr:PREDICTED: locomotion-related protein Hikaru genki isoform X2 [Megachile rotundata]
MFVEKQEKCKFFFQLPIGYVLFFVGLTIAIDCCDAKEIDTDGFHRGCKLEGLHPLLIVTYKNITVSVDKITVPHGERVTIRCRELGKYKLIGDSLLHCRDTTWTGKLPYCAPTTAISNYTEDVPPTIVFGLPAGSAAVEPSGALAVFPGSILHLECLFARKLGNPEWTWTSTFRQYLTGWAIAARERDWKYRLSIYYAKVQDSGVYTCSTPRGLSNSIRVRVVDVQCPILSLPESPLIGKIEGARMGHGATFECPVGFRLEGAAGITCQYNGKWSADVPRCETIECSSVDTVSDAWLQLIEYNNSFGGKAVFACMWGHKLLGSESIECQGDGSWSGNVPTCAGKVRCPYPGDPPHGRIAPLKFWYKPGDNIQVTCSPGYVTPLEPVRKPTCRENGIWSAPPPPCRSYKDV